MKQRVLTVDDNAINRKLLKALLKHEDLELIEAADGNEALDRAFEYLPDLILLDIMMPNKDGYQVCEELKGDERTAHLPIIFLSAKTGLDDKIRGLELGGADYVTKPFDKDEVLARVRTQLKIGRLTSELMAANAELMTANTALEAKQNRIEEDLEAAAGIQRSLLPQEMPDTEGLEISWRFLPCDSIGGDIFNIIRLDEDNWGIYMVDVSGHGVPSALVTVSVSQMLQPQRGMVLKKRIAPPPYYQLVPPGKVLGALDKEYPLERFDKFFTVSYLIVNSRTGSLEYSSAAHPPPVLLHQDGTIELLKEGGTIIGMGGILPFEEGFQQLAKGDRLFVYTDGIIEYESKNGGFYGEERFYETLASMRNQSLSKSIEKVVVDLMAFGDQNDPQDDISLMGIEFKGNEKDH
jgi:sigma-B regulation protein RsbU (phosphoserine phosphatase)